MTDISDQASGLPPTLRGRSSAETGTAVLDLIRTSGKISRVDLARQSALTEATISKIVKGLLATGLIVPAGCAESTGGKRPVLLKLNDGGRYAIGLTMDFHSSAIVLCGPDGTELSRTMAGGTGVDEPSFVLDRLAADVENLMAHESVDRSAVIGLGVASPGRRGFPQGWNVDPSFFDIWEPYSLEEELAVRTGLPAVRENDANCAALGGAGSARNRTATSSPSTCPTASARGSSSTGRSIGVCPATRERSDTWSPSRAASPAGADRAAAWKPWPARGRWSTRSSPTPDSVPLSGWMIRRRSRKCSGA